MKHAFYITACLCALLYALAATADSGGGSDSEYDHLDEAFQSAAVALEAENYPLAIIELDKLNSQRPGDADVLNLLGYRHRKLKQFNQAEAYYLDALALEPEHRGANEYLGELYLETDRLEEAQDRLDVLDSACFLPCKQYRDLKKAVKAYKTGQG